MSPKTNAALTRFLSSGAEAQGPHAGTARRPEMDFGVTSERKPAEAGWGRLRRSNVCLLVHPVRLAKPCGWEVGARRGYLLATVPKSL